MRLCAAFCQERAIPTEDLGLSRRVTFVTGEDGKRRLAEVPLDTAMPRGFPEKYRTPL